MAVQNRCNVCLSQFANKTQKKNHRSACAVHPGDEGMEVKEEDLEMNDLPLFDIVEDDGVEIIGRRNGLYLMKYPQRVEWMSLSKDNAFVKEFEADQNDECIDELPTVTAKNLREWMRNKVTDECVEADI